jgi:hypothetical protein
MAQKQLLLDETTDEYQALPVSTSVRMTPEITIIIEKAGNNQISNKFDSLDSYYEAIKFLCDQQMANNGSLQEILYSRKRNKEGEVLATQKVVNL